MRAAVAEAVAPLQQTIRELLRRIEELERRPAQQAAPAAVTVLASPVAAVPPEPHRQPQPSYPAAIAVPTAPAVVLATRAPTFDIAAIESNVDIEIDGAIDGRRRRRRLAVFFVLFLLLVFGGLFAAMAYSYSPHG